jgi:hypothetical protein
MSQLDEDGVLPDLVGGASRLVGKSARAALDGTKAAYGATNMGARSRAKKAVNQWVSRINRDWQEYAETQKLKDPRESDVYEFLQAEYGRFDPHIHDVLGRKIQELRTSEPDEAGYAEERGEAGNSDALSHDPDWAAFKHAASPDRDRPEEIRQRSRGTAQGNSQPASGKAWSQPGVGPEKKNWSAPDVKANPTSRAAQQTMQAQYARSQAARAPQKAPQAQQAPVHDREQHGPGVLRVGEQPPARADLANWDKSNIRHRHRSDTIDFDAFDHEDELHRQIDAARRERNKKLKREAAAPKARAILETAANVAAYAREKGSRAAALETISALQETFTGEAMALTLARRMIHENMSDAAVIAEAMRLAEADNPVSRSDLKVIFNAFARSLLRNPDVRYATIRLDPRNPRFDGFLRNINRSSSGHGGTPYAPTSNSPTQQRAPAQSKPTHETGNLPVTISTAELNADLERLKVPPHAFENLRRLVKRKGLGAIHDMGHGMDEDARKLLIALMAIIVRHGG